jgi:hypothetical protein
VRYAEPSQLKTFAPVPRTTTQVYEGASDLARHQTCSRKRAVQVCRIFAAANVSMGVRVSFDAIAWTPTTGIELEIESPQGSKLLSKMLGRADSHDASLEVQTPSKGFHSIFLTSANTPSGNKAPRCKVAVSYTAPQTR